MRFALFVFAAVIPIAEVAAQGNTPSPSTIEARFVNEIRLTGQFPGPFQDTLIQRWVDTQNGNTCYLYIPVILPSAGSQPAAGGQMATRFYGSNSMGSISCVGKPGGS